MVSVDPSTSLSRGSQQAHTDTCRQSELKLVALIAFEALTLAIFAALHLSGALDGGAKTLDPDAAGTAEAVICAALLVGLTGLVRSSPTGRSAALVSVAFAILGFVVGLTFTIRGGSTIDLTYHASMLPLLVATAALLTHGNRASSGFCDEPAFREYEGRAHGAPGSRADAGAGRVEPLPRDTDGLSS